MSRIEKCLLALFLLVVAGLGVTRINSWDIFWQLQSGRYVLATKHFIRQDLFSLAANVPRYEHCWLHDVLFYLTFRAAGLAGLSVLKGVLVVMTAIALIAAARLRGASYAAILLLTLPVFVVTGGAWHARPQIWSYLFFALFLLFWEDHRRNGSKRIWFLLPLMVVWANLHAGAILAFPVALAWVVGEGGDKWLGRSSQSGKAYRRLCLVAILLPLASLLTPYGLDVLRTLVAAPNLGKSSGVLGQMYNIDWRAMTFARNPDFYYLLIAALLLLVAGWRRFALADLLLLGGLGFMGLKLERHGPFFVMAMAALIPLYLDAAVAPLQARLTPPLLRIGKAGAFILAVVLLVHWGRPLYRARGAWRTGLVEGRYPVKAAEFVSENHLPANLFNSYEWGGYLMWKLYPAYRVFWDGRQDSASMFRQGLALMWGQHWREILDRNGVDTIVLKSLSDDDGGHYPILDIMRASPDWALVFNGVSSLVFVRRQAMGTAWLKGHELSKDRVEDTLLSEARLVSSRSPWHYKAWWEMARIEMKRKEYRQAYLALQQYFHWAPVNKRDPSALVYYKVLYPMMQH